MTNIGIGDLEVYRRIIENINEGLWGCNKNGETIYSNNTLCKITGYTTEEIKIIKYEKLWDIESQNIIENNINKGKEKYFLKRKGSLVTKNGTHIPISCNWSSIPGGGTVGLITDLSEINFLKEVEEKLRKINKTKDEFISIVGHELRTPLSSIKGYLSMILDGDMGEIDIDVRKALNHSYDSSNRLITLVNDVLSLSKIESGKMEFYFEDINVIDLLKSIYKDIYMQVENKSIDFKMDFNSSIDGLYIRADKDKLKQVFLNLLTNALKFTKSGGKITIKTRKIGDFIKFEIIDTGEGISREKLSYIFEKFNQVESTMQRQNTSGLGLGLALCRNIMFEFGSEIKVKSKSGKGSNFYFSIKVI